MGIGCGSEEAAEPLVLLATDVGAVHDAGPSGTDAMPESDAAIPQDSGVMVDASQSNPTCEGEFRGDYEIEDESDIEALQGYCSVSGQLLMLSRNIQRLSLPQLQSVGDLVIGG